MDSGGDIQQSERLGLEKLDCLLAHNPQPCRSPSSITCSAVLLLDLWSSVLTGAPLSESLPVLVLVESAWH
jgi:hypothetical protein